MDVSRDTDWLSIYVTSMLSFVGAAQFSLYFSSLWPYLQIVDHRITEIQFGYVVSIYSVGQIISSFGFGLWSNRIKQVQRPLLVGLLLMLLGNLIYVVLPLFSNKIIVILVSRFIAGMGSGNVSLLRAYASTASASKDRQKSIAYITCGQAFGQLIGPVLQLAFTGLAYPGIPIYPKLLYLNLYTVPAFLAVFLNLMGVLALWLLFTEIYAGLDETIPDKEVDEKCRKNHRSDLLALFICYLTRFTQMFVTTNLETIGGPLSMLMFGWTESHSVEITAIAQSSIGILAFCFYIIFIAFDLAKYLNLRAGCLFSIVALMLFHVITYSWPFLGIQVPTYNSTSMPWQADTIDSTDEPTGCDIEKFTWCTDLKQVNVWFYYGCYILFIGLSIPILTISMTTLFSQILGPRRQGTQQGILQVFGGMARMIGPVFMSTLYSDFGPRMAWNAEILFLVLMSMLWIYFYSRMVPSFARPRQLNEFRRNTSIKDIENGHTIS